MQSDTKCLGYLFL